jgi:hypothetical protein
VAALATAPSNRAEASPPIRKARPASARWRSAAPAAYIARLAVSVGGKTFECSERVGGSISLTYVPTNTRDARNLQTGLALYSMFNGIANGSSITQRGVNNLAGIGQLGSGNLGVVHQEGSGGHSATLNQYGRNNAHGIFQFGKNTSANVGQYGYGQTGATFDW